MIKRILYLILIVIGFGFLFFISVWVHLSPQRLTPWIASQFNSILPRTLNIDIQAANPEFGGITFSKVRLSDKRTNSEIVKIDTASISFNLFRILTNLGIPYSMELYRGKIEGVLKFLPARINFQIDAVQPNDHMTLRNLQIIQSEPTIAGKGSFFISNWPTGYLDFHVEDVIVSGDKKRTGLMIDLPSATITRLKGSINVENDKLTTEIRSSGDITGTLTGITLLNRKMLDRSNLDLNFIGQVERKYRNKLNDLLKQILQSYTASNGQIRIKIKGTVKAPGVQKY